MSPRIGITIGDPSGVGPEIALKVLERREVLASCIPILYGDRSVLERVRPIVGCTRVLQDVERPEEVPQGAVGLVSLGLPRESYAFGMVQGSCGRAAYAYVERAIKDALCGGIDAVVTAPVNKEALRAGGIPYSGHTEIFADLTGSGNYAMLLTGGKLRVIHVSTHVSLLEACGRVRKDRILTVVRLADEAVRGLGVPRPRIAVAGLNPHSGESGLFGTEEQREIAPAVERAQEEGFDVTGPVPPDTVFLKALEGEFDVVVAMYHDQGHIPLKLTDFMGGVNITVGLPIIRTSVDHGTAFDKAGQGTADESSLAAAIGAAVRLAGGRKSAGMP